MKKRKLLPALTLAFVFVLTLLLSSFPGSAKASTYVDTDLLVAYRVSGSGYILSPVSVKVQARVDYTSVSLGGVSNYLVTYREVYTQTLTSYWSLYPTASLQVGNLKLRGSAQSLPTVGTYLVGGSYTGLGRYNSASSVFNITSAAASGNSVFFTGTSGYIVGSNSPIVNFTF